LIKKKVKSNELRLADGFSESIKDVKFEGVDVDSGKE